MSAATFSAKLPRAGIESRDVDRVVDDLAARFPDRDDGAIEALVVEEFGRRSGAPVQDFVPVFVERALRDRLRSDK